MAKKHLLKDGIENSAILHILLFLACLNFMGRGPIIFLLFCIWGCIKTCAVRLDWNLNSVCYLFMTISSVIVSLLFLDGKDVIKSVVYFLSFVVGYKGYIASKGKENYIKRITFSAFAGYFSNLFITFYTNFIVRGHIEGQRELYNFWTNDVMAVTLAGLMSCVPIAYSFYCLFCKKNLFFKFLGVTCILLVVCVNMGTATRTPFALLIIVYICMTYELLRDEGVRNKKGVVFFLSSALFLVLYKILPNMADSAIAERFLDEGIKTSRTDITVTYMENMLDYPYGGLCIYNKTKLLAHNFILESYDMYGFTFFIPVIILIFLFLHRFYFMHKLYHKDDVTFLLLSMYLSIGVQIMLEPVIQGYPQLIWTLFLIDGMTISYLKDVANRRYVKK